MKWGDAVSDWEEVTVSTVVSSGFGVTSSGVFGLRPLREEREEEVIVSVDYYALDDDTARRYKWLEDKERRGDASPKPKCFLNGQASGRELKPHDKKESGR